ncbi:prepilin peptidase [Pseudocitrobacter faecalis]|uniref:Leader peptidase HopD n=1 Tax=Pseudocitrobacter faecalis TaxID=1398493 RepID=A0ABX9FSA3_9ENTR|nr:leader peptidase HopD [Pseudocitrobacter faecalis]
MSYAPLPFFVIYTLLTLALSWHDWRTGLLPDRLTCPLLLGGVLYHLCFYPARLSLSLWGAIGGYIAFALIYWGYRGLRHREGLGYGDVKFLAALGAWHGWQALPELILTATLLALIFISLSALHLREWQALKNPLPFGPFLAAAGFIIYGLGVT